MNARHATLAGLACLAAACNAPSTASLVPLPLEVNVVGSATVSLDRLRLTVMFEGDDDVLVFGPDVAVTSTGTPITLQIEHPGLIGAPPQQFGLRLTPDGQGVLVGRARLIAYLDHDGSGSFQYGEGISGPDQPLGIDDYWRGLAWLIAPERQIGGLTSEAAASYYAATDQRYAGSVAVLRSGSSELVPDTTRDPTLVDIARLSIVNADLACRRQLVNTTDPPPVRTLWVDRALDPDQVCGLEIADCRAVDTSTLTPPALPDPNLENPYVATHAQCRRRGGLELLVVQEDRVACDPTTCQCADLVHAEVVATSTSAPPPWWPCGEAVARCPSTRPLYEVDPACFEDDEEDE